MNTRYKLAAMACFTLLANPALAASTYQCSVDKGCVVATNVETNNNYAATAYPIVLAHGMMGFNRIVGVSYWYNVPENLAANGANVYVSKVSGFNSSAARGEQLLAQVRTVLAITGRPKVNLIAHSQGGIDQRYVLGVSPQSVASATSIGSPHKGTKHADIVEAMRTFPLTAPLTPVASGLANLLAHFVNFLSGGGSSGALQQDALAGLATLTTTGALANNAILPEGIPATACGEGNYYAANGAALFSWGGVMPNVSWFDASDWILKGLSFFGDPGNDGLVGRCSNHFGKVIKDDYKLNHVDQVNHLFGMTGNVDPKALLRQHANRLKLLGL